ELDRILDRDDVRRRVSVAVIDHRGERRRLARAARADHENQPAPKHDEILERVRDAEILEARQVRRDEPQDHRDVAALMEDVYSKAAEPRLRYREVDLEIARERLELRLVHQLERRLTHHLRRQLHLIDGQDLAVDLD